MLLLNKNGFDKDRKIYLNLYYGNDIYFIGVDLVLAVFSFIYNITLY